MRLSVIELAREAPQLPDLGGIVKIQELAGLASHHHPELDAGVDRAHAPTGRSRRSKPAGTGEAIARSSRARVLSPPPTIGSLPRIDCKCWSM